MKRKMQSDVGNPPPGNSDPEISDLLEIILKRLTCADDAQRRDAVSRIQAETIPALRTLIIDSLIAQLQSQSEQIRRGAAESLFEMGEVVVPALRCALVSSPGTTIEIHVAELLGRIGAACSPRRQFEIQTALEITRRRTKNPKVAIAILMALDQIRPGTAALEIALSQIMAGRGL